VPEFEYAVTVTLKLTPAAAVVGGAAVNAKWSIAGATVVFWLAVRLLAVSATVTV
jgi:hypothetical protein